MLQCLLLRTATGTVRVGCCSGCHKAGFSIFQANAHFGAKSIDWQKAGSGLWTCKWTLGIWCSFSLLLGYSALAEGGTLETGRGTYIAVDKCLSVYRLSGISCSGQDFQGLDDTLHTTRIYFQCYSISSVEVLMDVSCALPRSSYLTQVRGIKYQDDDWRNDTLFKPCLSYDTCGNPSDTCWNSTGRKFCWRTGDND